MIELKTWGECLDYDLEHNVKHRPERGGFTSFRLYTGYLTRLRGRSLPVNRMSIEMMDQCGRELEEEGKADATINRFTSAVHSVLFFCYQRKKIPQPNTYPKRKEVEGRPQWFTKEQVDEIEKCARGLFYRDDVADISTFGAYTGLRQGEILKLKAGDIDLTKGSIYVGGRPGFQTKTGKWREVPIHPKVAPILAKRLENAPDTLRIFGDEWSTKEVLLRNFKKVTAFLEIPPSYVFHCLRHSFGVFHAEAGTPMRTLMDLMGHTCIETTLRYAKVSDSARRNAMSNI